MTSFWRSVDLTGNQTTWGSSTISGSNPPLSVASDGLCGPPWHEKGPFPGPGETDAPSRGMDG